MEDLDNGARVSRKEGEMNVSGTSESDQERKPQAAGSEMTAEAFSPTGRYDLKISQRDIYDPVALHQRDLSVDQLYEDPYVQVMDNGIELYWKKASHQVDNVALSLIAGGDCSPLRPWDSLDSELQGTLLSWTPRAREMFEDPARIHYLFAARIWHTLHDHVFSGDPEVMRESMGPAWGHFASLMEIFKGKSCTSFPLPHFPRRRYRLANAFPP